MQTFCVEDSPPGRNGGPFLVNPNSYDNVYEVLKHLQTHNPRAWYDVGSNDVPYALAHLLRHSTPDQQDILLLP